MPRLISLSSTFSLLAFALPALAQTTVTHAPVDEKRAEANVFMTAKVIAIQPERDRIQIRDNDGVKRTLVLDDDATLPEGRVKSGTDVILAVRDTGGGQRRVVSVQRSEPAARRPGPGPQSRAEPVFIPAPTGMSAGGLRDLATAQTSYQSGTTGVPMAGEPQRVAAPLWGPSTGVPLFDANGVPLTDMTGRPQANTGLTAVPLTDASGQPFVDASGQTLMAVRGTLFTDQTGQPIVDGAGRPLLVDPTSAQTVLDGSGRPLQPVTGTFLTNAHGIPVLDDSGRAFVTDGRTFRDTSGRLFRDATGRRVDTAIAPTGAATATTIQPSTSPQFRAGTSFTSAGPTAPGAVPGTTIRSAADFTPPNMIAPEANMATLTTPVPGTSIAPVLAPAGGVGVINAAPVRTFTNADLARVGGGGSIPMAAGPVNLGVGGSGGVAVRTAPDGESISVPQSGPPQAGPDLGGLGSDASPLPIGHAVQAFEGSMARLSMQVTAVDAAFSRYREMCLGPRAMESSGGPSWLGIWNGSTPPPESRDECEPILAAALRLAEQVQRGVRTAEDGARRSRVLPGVRRQIRAQYGMDWMGWDQ